jgi:MSHA biogenesis protein MshP
MTRTCLRAITTQQRGFALVPAIFLIVVLSALGAVAVRLGSTQSQTVNLSLLSSRALAAANTGVEWAAASNTCPATTTLNLTQGGLAGFKVTITCTSTPHTEAGSPVKMFVVDSVASSGTYGMPDFVSRRVRARLIDAT